MMFLVEVRGLYLRIILIDIGLWGLTLTEASVAVPGQSDNAESFAENCEIESFHKRD